MPELRSCESRGGGVMMEREEPESMMSKFVSPRQTQPDLRRLKIESQSPGARLDQINLNKKSREEVSNEKRLGHAGCGGVA